MPEVVALLVVVLLEAALAELLPEVALLEVALAELLPSMEDWG